MCIRQKSSKLRITITMRVLAAFALWIPVSLTGQAQDTATLQGTIRDVAGHPVAGATVQLQASAKHEAQTDLQGAYRVAVAPGSAYTLRAEKSGVGEATFGPFALADRETKTIDLKLSPKNSAAEFYDQPQFTVAGVSDSMAPGGHGSDRALRSTEGLAKDVVSLNKDEQLGSPRTAPLMEKSLKEAAERDPANFAANHRLGELLAESGRASEAILYLERAFHLKPDDYSTAYELARAYAQVGQLEQARTQATELLGQQDTAELHHLLGDVHEKMGEPLDAVREYQRAAELSPSEPNLFDWGAELLLHRAFQPAIEVYSRGHHLFPHSSRMLVGLGVSQHANGSHELAVQSLCQASDLKPDDPTPYLFLGKMQNSDAAQPEAMSQRLARFAQLHPDNALANYYYALSLWKRRSGLQDAVTLAKVESLLAESIRLDPKFGPGYLQLGILYANRKDFPRAISTYQKAIEVSPQLEEAHFRLAQVYRQTGEKSKAQDELQLFEQISKKTAEEVDRERRELPQFVYTLRGQPAQ